MCNFFRGDPSAVLRLSATISCLVATATGYLIGRLDRRSLSGQGVVGIKLLASASVSIAPV
jgi:hypothetical protein